VFFFLFLLKWDIKLARSSFKLQESLQT